MPLDGLNVLEEKIDKLLNELKCMREESAKNTEKNKQFEEKISILEKENEKLNSQASNVAGAADEKIRGDVIQNFLQHDAPAWETGRRDNGALVRSPRPA